MFEKISTTWSLMGESWEMLKQDKELLLFPAVSGICCLLVMASFAAPMIATDSWQPPAEGSEPAQYVAYYGTLFLFYFLNYYVITFFNVAIVACASLRMNGGDPTVGDGFRAAFSRMHLIFGWALIAATVGLILRIIEDRNEKIGRFVAGLLGMAWTAVSFLVVPVMVMENKSPFKCLTESTRLLKRTWGHQLISNFSFGGVFFLLGIPGFALIALGVFLLVGGNAPVGVLCLAFGVGYMILLSLIQATLQCIFQAALYYYARDRQVPAGSSFSQAGLSDAFYSK